MMTTFAKRLAIDVPLLNANHLSFIVARTATPDDIQAAENPYFKAVRAYCEPKVEHVKNIAIVPVQGVIAYNPDPWEMLYDGVEDSRNIVKMLNDVSQDEQVQGVLLRVDTPGGMMLGGPEIADAVASLRSRKPVVAHIGGLGASLGYMIASQASEVIASRSAIVGSIGVIASVTDYTALLEKLGVKFEYFTNKEAKYKGAGAIGNPLTDEQRENIQSSVDSSFKIFKNAVLSMRPDVPDSAMQGQTFRGDEAKKQKLVDRIGGETFALSVLKSMMKN